MSKKRNLTRRVKKQQSGIPIPRIPVGLIVSSSGPRGRVFESRKKYNRKRMRKKIKAWDRIN